jgi:diguanylate cyclase (GGDEF)-like protein
VSVLHKETEPASADWAAGMPARDLEPWHTPSAIQPHGVLIAARCSDLQVVYVSANSPEMFGGTPASILAQRLPGLLGERAMSAVEEALMEEQYAPASIPTCNFPAEGKRRFDVAAHRVKDLYCLEFQPEAQSQGRDPLSARMQRAIQDLRRQKTQRDLWKMAVTHLRKLTGYDRAMVQRYDPDGNGEVIAEDKAAAMESYLGLHYPATEVPPQARKLYLNQRLRVIVDAVYRPVAVLGHPEFAPEERLDMTHCVFRSVPAAHLESLQSMGVRATLSISLIYRNELWGMMVCHHRSPKHLSPEMRSLCELLGQLLSMLIDVSSQAEEYSARTEKQEILDLLNTAMERGDNVGASLAEMGQHLCSLVGADGACIQFGGQLRLVGSTPVLAETKSILSALRPHLSEGLTFTSEIGRLMPGLLRLSPGVSGILMIPVMRGPFDTILWFRRETVRTVEWGGDPEATAGEERHPGKPFERRAEVQRGRSLPWLESEIQAAQSFQRSITNALLRHTEAKLAPIGHSDPLTELPNRRVLLARLAEWLNGALDTEAALLFLDVDHFKTVNDSFGRSIGDELLRQVASRLSFSSGERHLVARLGGDEFVLFCTGAGVAEAEALATRLIEAFTEPFLLGGRPFRTTASIGIAPVRAGSAGSETESLQAADSAMYVAKQRGGNQYAVYESPLHEKVLRQLLLEQGLYQALENEELFVEYQPKIALDTLELLGFEALLRWAHPVYGLVSLGEFIPLAEKTGQIVPIGTWVLREALRQIRDWRGRFDARLTMAVNVSAQQVSRDDFRQTVEFALRDMEVGCDSLHLEVTESILMHDIAVSHLQEVRSSGVTVAVDDFGTGYSSLSYLQRLPIDEIKIDRTFMEMVGEDERKTALFGAVIHMAHTLGLKVVGEGVESGRQLSCVRHMACDGVQGYFISRPLPPHGIELEMNGTSCRKPFEITRSF